MVLFTLNALFLRENNYNRYFLTVKMCILKTPQHIPENNNTKTGK